jgi:hypothetical protein
MLVISPPFHFVESRPPTGNYNAADQIEYEPLPRINAFRHFFHHLATQISVPGLKHLHALNPKSEESLFAKQQIVRLRFVDDFTDHESPDNSPRLALIKSHSLHFTPSSS